MSYDYLSSIKRSPSRIFYSRSGTAASRSFFVPSVTRVLCILITIKFTCRQVHPARCGREAASLAWARSAQQARVRLVDQALAGSIGAGYPALTGRAAARCSWRAWYGRAAGSARAHLLHSVALSSASASIEGPRAFDECVCQAPGP